MSLFYSPQKDLKKIMPLLEPFEQLADIKENLNSYQFTAEKALDCLVKFFQATSPVYDNIRKIRDAKEKIEKKKGEKDLAESIKILYAHLENSGRNRYGMNRTNPGQPVTYDNVYFGGRDGLNIHPVRKWIEILQKKEDNELNKGIYRGVSAYLNSHLGPLIEVTEKLKSYSK
ncbi:MAG: hypothetical protein QXP53_00275 [Candidatus Pacearchaeota archaeon]